MEAIGRLCSQFTQAPTAHQAGNGVGPCAYMLLPIPCCPGWLPTMSPLLLTEVAYYMCKLLYLSLMLRPLV